MEKKDAQKIAKDFAVRRNRQIVAVAATLVLMLLLAALYKRPDLFGEFSKTALVNAQLLLILVFLNFSAYNWRCPSCRKFLGNDITRRVCGQCGARLR